MKMLGSREQWGKNFREQGAWNLTIKPEVSVDLFGHLLLHCLWTDRHQTWQEGRGGERKKPRGTHHVVMATEKTAVFMIRSGLSLDIGWV